MNKAFEKILERLEGLIEQSYYESSKGNHDAGIRNNAYHKVSIIVQEVAREYNNGWIPIEQELPPQDTYILLSFFNFSLPVIGRYEEDEEGNGNFYAGDEDETLLSQDMYVNAWQPLPEPYSDN